MKLIDDLRKEIDAVDREIKVLLDKRFEISKKIGESKQGTGKKIFDPEREALIFESIKSDATLKNAEEIARVYTRLMRISCDVQERIVNQN